MSTALNENSTTVCDTGAKLCSAMLEQGSAVSASADGRHSGGLVREPYGQPHSPGGSSPHNLSSRLLRAALVRHALAVSTAVTIITASEVEGVIAVAIGSRINDSELFADAGRSAGRWRRLWRALRRRMAAQAAQQRGGLDQAVGAADFDARMTTCSAFFA